jgi:hypothetical protein
VLRREEAAFEALMRRHGGLVFSVCRRALHEVQAIEDAFQATFLVLAQKAPRPLPSENPSRSRAGFMGWPTGWPCKYGPARIGGTVGNAMGSTGTPGSRRKTIGIVDGG